MTRKQRQTGSVDFLNAWDTRPIEDALRAEIAQMTAEIEEYRASVKCKQETVNWKDHT